MFVYRRYLTSDFEHVKRLCEAGNSNSEIAQMTGFPRETIWRWRQRNAAPRSCGPAKPQRFAPQSWTSYAYLLGVYLGDGHLFRISRWSYRLGIYCDARHPGVIAEISRAVRNCVPGIKVDRRPTSENGVALLASSPVWSKAFPQHGPGRKHERPIELEAWQRKITHEHPQALLRGLIHSDGCRCMNRFRTKLPSGRVAEYEYPRYFFTNLSADIREIFCEHCDLLGVRWTQSNPRNISVSHRRSVAILDRFIGPKS